MAVVGPPSAVAPGAPLAPGGASAPTVTEIPEQLVIEGSLTVEVREIGDVVVALRAQVEAGGGRVIAEEVTGGETSWRAQLRLRVPPGQVDGIAAWLTERGEIHDKRITATDVSRVLFDQELALTNLQATSARLQRLLDQGGLAMKDILDIEKELTRIRGEIEAIKGSQRFLQDRVALATIDVTLTRRDGAVRVARAKLYPGARFATMVLLAPEGRPRTRHGVGIVAHTLMRTASIELDLFEAEASAPGAAAKAAVIATVGGATYSDFLGRGERRFLNPYLGLRLGYAYLDGGRFALQGEAGVELFKHAHVVIDASVRATGLIGGRNDAALVGGVGAVVSF
jgi:hypothetical protein